MKTVEEPFQEPVEVPARKAVEIPIQEAPTHSRNLGTETGMEPNQSRPSRPTRMGRNPHRRQKEQQTERQQRLYQHDQNSSEPPPPGTELARESVRE